MNPANCPEINQIEKIWAIVKRILKKTKKTATDDQSLLKIWNKAQAEVGEETVQNLMASIKKKVRNFNKNGDFTVWTVTF